MAAKRQATPKEVGGPDSLGHDWIVRKGRKSRCQRCYIARFSQEAGRACPGTPQPVGEYREGIQPQAEQGEMP